MEIMARTLRGVGKCGKGKVRRLALGARIVVEFAVATIFSHPAVPLAVGCALGTRVIPRRLLEFGVLASILPDIDVAAFRFGIPYENMFGHRGFTHSILFAVLVGIAFAVLSR